jgi:hypothetical protein
VPAADRYRHIHRHTHVSFPSTEKKRNRHGRIISRHSMRQTESLLRAGFDRKGAALDCVSVILIV